MQIKTSILFSVILILSGCDSLRDNSIEYGESRLYFTESVKHGEAVRLGDFLHSQGVFNGNGKLFQLDKGGDTYRLNAAVKGGMGGDRQVVSAIKEMANAISRHSFSGAPFKIVLTDNEFNPLPVP